MDRHKGESLVPGADDNETRSILSMQELEPSPVDDFPPNLERGDYFPETQNSTTRNTGRFAFPKLGLSGHGWDYYCMSSQSY
jgi:tRNA (guanine26-N2/guanine27-N2)-dimethyltransferase